MRDRLIFLWELFWGLRLSPDRRVRGGWYLAVLTILSVVLGLPGPRTIAIALTGVFSILFSFAAVAWGIFHPRSLLPAVSAVWRWAGWLTVIAVVGIYAGAIQLATTLLSVPVPTVGVLSVLLVLLPVLFALFFLYGCLGAAVSAFTARRWPERARLTRVGANAWWLLTLGGLVAIMASPLTMGTDDTAFVLSVLAPVFTIPLFTTILCALARNPDREPRRVAEHLLQRLSRYLTFRRRWRKQTLEIDLRGAMLGLLVSAAVFGLLRPVLKAPSASLLVWMIQVRNQEAQGAWSSPETMDASSFLGSGLARRDLKILARRRQIALIDLDAPVLRAAFAPAAQSATSTAATVSGVKSALSAGASPGARPTATLQTEAALDALLIRRLHALGAAVIVLFPPQDSPPKPSDGGKPSVPAPSKQTQTQTQTLPRFLPGSSGKPPALSTSKPEQRQSDEPLLVAAVKEARNVVLALPSRDPKMRSHLQMQLARARPFSPELIAAARAAAGEELFSYGSMRLPVLPPEDPNAPASLPLVVAQWYARLSQSDAAYGFKGRSLAPVDFSSAEPDHDFLHIDASNLVNPSTMQAMGAERIQTPDGQWRTLEECIRGRIVFLDTRVAHSRETPIGVLPVREVLAYATATVLAHEKGLRVATTRSLLLALLFGTLMGALCAHRTPFEAVGRLLSMAAILVFASVICYMLWKLWLDAVVPMAAILLTYLLVTQLAFTQQREKDRDLLKRFVAPEFVDAMLDHPSGHLGLEGKLSHVCVLFADVRNFTGFAERHRPEEVFAAVNEYMTALTNALHVYGGVLDKYTGDGLMAWFPAEANTRRQIEKAVRATLAMRDAAMEISRSRAAQNKPALDFGIGMH
ncbi:MAG: transrane sensor domain-like protein [Chthonomonadaceae bacterium]|nr:transrane sensor domain-like protein [Chthonomonadaceae bacterium]